MKKKYIALVALPIAASAIVLAGTVSAHGMFGFGGSSLTPQQVAQNEQARFQNEADLLGVSVDEVKNAWAKGETLQQLAQDHGITQDQLQQKLKDAAQQRMKDHLQSLVSQGVITQDQADQRLQFMQQQSQNKRGHVGPGMMGAHRGFGL